MVRVVVKDCVALAGPSEKLVVDVIGAICSGAEWSL